MIEKLINYLACIPMEDKNKFGKQIEQGNDIAHDYVIVSIDDSGNYYRLDIDLETVHYERCVGEGEFEDSEDSFERIESVECVSYWNWEDDECLKVLDTTEGQLKELLTYLPNTEY